MPKGDGTGPAGGGTGRGQGQGKGTGRGRMGGNRPGSGPGGYCVCSQPDCDGKVPHQSGQPCYQVACPECGSKMAKE